MSLLIEQMSKVLPWQGCIPPSLSTQIQSDRNLGLVPSFLSCSKNLGAHYLNTERQISKTVDSTKVLEQFKHLDRSIQAAIAELIGITDVKELNEVLMSE